MPGTAPASSLPRTAAHLDLGAATHLSCRECGATSPLGAFYACVECFGPLEVGYDFGQVSRERIAAGHKLLA